MKNILLTTIVYALAAPILALPSTAPTRLPSHSSGTPHPSPRLQGTEAPFPSHQTAPHGNSSNTTQTPLYRGFSVSAWQGGQNKPVKTKDDWKAAFDRIKSLPGNFNAARMYAVQDSAGGVQTMALPNILAAAKESEINVLIGLYLGSYDGGERFELEFGVLKETVAEFGLNHIIGITVGNEDLYRGTTDPALLASQITQVQSWLDTEHPHTCIPVGHVDTWTQLTNTTNAAVTDASDFLVANVFPYWEKATLDRAAEYFDAAIANLTSFEEMHGLEVWIGETGWPFTPAADEAFVGVPGKEMMQRYWNEVVCGPGFMGRNSFYYIDCDDGDTPEWGVFDGSGQKRIEMGCPGPV